MPAASPAFEFNNRRLQLPSQSVSLASDHRGILFRRFFGV